ncbi:MAG: DUF5916 domain-containing protein [Cyclobacteriaceae bacterium]
MKLLLSAILLLATQLTWAQGDGYKISRAKGEIIIDGVIDEEDWANADVAGDFMQYFPADSIRAEVQTEMRMTYDDNFVYFVAKMYNKSADRDYVTPSLRRDYRGEANDGFTIVIDPFLDNTNAFQFGVNPFGVQREGLIANGGNRGDDLSLAWDNKWYAEAKRYDGYWIAEGAIPFKTLRYKEGLDRWNINFYRIDSETGERSTWTPIPRNFRLISLAFVRQLEWDQPLKKPGANVSLIPYVAGVSSRDFEDETQESTEYNVQAGGDAKIAVTSGLNLDITINPDFSQVEVDEQVTNLDRFEIFFPERRQFFLENADLFSDFGHPIARPFFSRRIGVARDSSTGQNIQNKIPFGIRLSGKLDNNWRVGLLNMQAAKDESIDLPSTNYTVAVVQRKVFARSNIGLIFVNRQSTQDSLGEFTFKPEQYNRVLGIDYNLASADGKWSGKAFYHRSFDEDNTDDQFSHSAYIDYQSLGLRFNWAHVIVGENFEAETGFVPRTGVYRINPEVGYFFYPQSSWINNIGPVNDIEIFWNNERMTDLRYSFNLNTNLQNTGRINLTFNRLYTYLLDSFDPTNTEGVELPANTDYDYYNFEFNYSSDFRRKFGYRLRGSMGTYFNGDRRNISGEVTYRTQPYGSISVNFNYNRITLPEPYNSADLFLIGPRFDLTMTKSLFFTTFVQYNSQIENVNINARLQWRFKPVSDLFIVYTDNYGTMNDEPNAPQFTPKNRALVFKLTYWLNL